MLMTFLQGTTEKTADLEGAVTDTAKGAGREISRVQDFFAEVYAYLTSTEFIGNVIASALVVFLGLFAFRILTHGLPRVLRWRRRRAEDLLDAEAVARIKRQDTAITLIRNALRYIIFLIVVLFILSIFVRNPLPATAGATIIAAVIGFGAQSFLRDVIAGFSIIFEGQYSVGDFIHVKPQEVSGIVEELGLRMTKIRSLSGEVSYIPNGAMQGVINYVSGQQRFTVEVQLSDPEAVPRVLGPRRGLGALPRPAAPRGARGDRRQVAVAHPGRGPPIDGMAGRGEPRGAHQGRRRRGRPRGRPLVYKVDQENLRRVRDLLPQEVERNLPPEAERKLRG